MTAASDGEFASVQWLALPTVSVNLLHWSRHQQKIYRYLQREFSILSVALNTRTPLNLRIYHRHFIDNRDSSLSFSKLPSVTIYNLSRRVNVEAG